MAFASRCGFSIQSRHATTLQPNGASTTSRKGCQPVNKLWAPRASLKASASEADQPGISGHDPSEEPVLPKGDWRDFRASLVALERKQAKEQASALESTLQNQAAESPNDRLKDKDIWAHQLASPETGCILIPRRRAGDIGFFNNSVVFILRHDPIMGSSGLLLGRKQTTPDSNPLNQIVSMFSHLHCGGPVRREKIMLLHGPPSLENSAEIVKDIFLGGWRDAVHAMEKKDRDMPEMTMYAGHCGWGVGQMENEVKMGTWCIVSASHNCIRQMILGSMSEEEIRSWITKLAGLPGI